MRRSVARSFGLGLVLVVAASMPSAAGTIGVAWSSVANAAGYRVYYGLAAGAYAQFKDVGPVTETTLSGLDDCKAYYVAVKAYNSAGESAGFSNEVSGWARPTNLEADAGQPQPGR